MGTDTITCAWSCRDDPDSATAVDVLRGINMFEFTHIRLLSNLLYL